MKLLQRYICAGLVALSFCGSLAPAHATLSSDPQTLNGLLPSQTGNGGKFLGTNGTTPNWLNAVTAGGMDALDAASGSTTGAVVRTSTGTYALASSSCSLFASPTLCAWQLGYADPRQFGASCGSFFNVNNNTQDDAPGIMAAMATGVPVMIPYPGCKIASYVKASGNGQTLFSFAEGNTYNSNFPGSPYIFVTNDVATNSSSNNCAFDWNGYDGITLRNITFRGNYNLEGTVAICNSVGIRAGLGAAFLNIDNVSINNMGGGIGAAMQSVSSYPSTNCQPVGSLMNPVLQIRGHGLNIIGSCNAMYGNFSDVHLNDVFIANSQGACLAIPSGGGAALDVDNFRCEYNFPSPNSAGFFLDGAGIVLNTAAGGQHFANVVCDHIAGSCIQLASGSKHIQLANITSVDSGGNWQSSSSPITNQCAYTMLGATDVSAVGMEAYKNNVNVPYTLCMPSGSNDYITWEGVSGASGGTGGYSTAYLNIPSPPAHFVLRVPGLYDQTNGAPSSRNLNTAALPAAQTGSVVQLGNANGTVTRHELDSFAAASHYSGVRWDGTAASPTALLSGDEMASINAWGYNGSAVAGPRAAFRTYAAQNWTSSNQGTYADVAVTPLNSATLAEVARFENDGGITVPSTVTGGDKGAGTINAAALYVNGVAVGGGVNSLTGDGSLFTNSASTGAVTLALGAQAKNTVLAGPGTGANATPGFRALTGSDLPNPSATTLGGIESITSLAHNWISYIDTSGIPHQSQPSFADLSGTASNAQIPAPTVSTLGGIEAASGATANQFMTYVDTSGVQHTAQPAFSNVSGSATAAQLPTGSNSALGVVQCDGTTITCAAGVITAASSGSGTVTASPQYDLAYFPSAGTVATVQGNSGVVTDSSHDLFLGGGIGIGTTSLSSSVAADIGGYGAPTAVGAGSIVFATNRNGISGIEMKNTSSGTSADERFVAYANDGSAYLAFAIPSTGNTQSSLFGLTRSNSVFLFDSGTTSRSMGIGPLGSATLILGTNSTAALSIGTDQGVTVGSPTGGDKGTGTINAAGVYQAGAQVVSAAGNGIAVSGGTASVSPYILAASASVLKMRGETGLQVPGQGSLPGNVAKTNKANNFIAAQNINANAGASAPSLLISGAPFTSGTTSTNWPQLLVQNTGMTSSAWNANGTLLGVNAPSGFSGGAGNLMDLQTNGSSKFSVSGNGTVTNSAQFVCNGSNREFVLNNQGHMALGNLGFLAWNSSSNAGGGTEDTVLSRDSANVIDVGNAQGDKSGTLQAASFVQGGTAFASSKFINAMSASAVMANFGGL